jgi:hypothetical protein
MQRLKAELCDSNNYIHGQESIEVSYNKWMHTTNILQSLAVPLLQITVQLDCFI